MLLRFSVENHRSLRDAIELVFHDGTISRPGDAAVVGGVFGVNGAGKSNTLSALAWFSSAVSDSLRWGDDWDSCRVPATPFAYADDDAPISKFSVDVAAADGVRYRYEFDVADALLGERLYSYPHGRRRTVFERNRDELALGRGVPGARLLRALSGGDTLLLSFLMRAREHPLIPLAKQLGTWQIIPSELPRLAESPPLDIFGEVAEGDADRLADRQLALCLVRLADPTVADVVKAKRVGDVIFSDPQWCVIHQAGPGRRVVLVDQASAGIRTMLMIADPIVKALRARRVLLFEDFDQHLHPSVAKAIIALFRNHNSNPAGSQLIFTANNTELLHQMTFRGERPARAWWARKGNDGATALIGNFTIDDACRGHTECADAAFASVAPGYEHRS